MPPYTAPPKLNFGGAFSTVVRVDPKLLAERGAAAAAVHGIGDHEIAMGPDFPTAWRRFLLWTESLLNDAVTDMSDSEAVSYTHLTLPTILLV